MNSRKEVKCFFSIKKFYIVNNELKLLYWSKPWFLNVKLRSAPLLGICSQMRHYGASNHCLITMCGPNTGNDLNISQLRSGHQGIPPPHGGVKKSGVLGKNVFCYLVFPQPKPKRGVCCTG